MDLIIVDFRSQFYGISALPIHVSGTKLGERGREGRGRKEEDPIQPPPFYHGTKCSVEVCTAGTGSCLFPCSGCCTIIRLLLWLVARRHSSFRAHELADTGLCLEGRSEVLRTLRHCMPSIRAQELYQSRGGRPCGRKAALNPNCTDLNFAPKKGIGCGLCPPPPHPPTPTPHSRQTHRRPDPMYRQGLVRCPLS